MYCKKNALLVSKIFFTPIRAPYFHWPKRGQFRKTKPKRPSSRKVPDRLKTFFFDFTIFEGQNQRKNKWFPKKKKEKVFSFALILPFENGNLQTKKRSSGRQKLNVSVGGRVSFLVALVFDSRL